AAEEDRGESGGGRKSRYAHGRSFLHCGGTGYKLRKSRGQLTQARSAGEGTVPSRTLRGLCPFFPRAEDHATLKSIVCGPGACTSARRGVCDGMMYFKANCICFGLRPLDGAAAASRPGVPAPPDRSSNASGSSTMTRCLPLTAPGL